MANHQLQPIASYSSPFLSLVTLMATGRWVGRLHQGRQPAAALRHVATGRWVGRLHQGRQPAAACGM